MSLELTEQFYQEYTAAYEAGSISKDEYANLLRGLEVESQVAETAEELAKKEELNTMVNAAITAVSLVA